ncbi:uncharacterized protein BX664DRAFT_335476 [Halteromyces radiatus]|uniref:uncharacterized protein n=1 Tax=Halteromyces radiatus TaxID=101107 RepID=UPI0022205E3A|nr:uncharacterized protein BX664DRAFT_335476 [Halteromyces radiatus]KAI8086304.1 hypothetical protein BX664DRAFT_335476 [Halteromyces radiatus]
MYQENTMNESACTFDNNNNNNSYDYQTPINVPWIHGTNRHSPPPPLMMMPVGYEQHPLCQSVMTTPPSASARYYGQYHPLPQSSLQQDMCQPLIMDDYASNVSSPELQTGPLLLPPSPTDILSSSSSPTIDDQWMDLYSPPPLHHPPYLMEQRHSFDDALYFSKQQQVLPLHDDIVCDSMQCPYSCNNNDSIGYSRSDSPMSAPSLMMMPPPSSSPSSSSASTRSNIPPTSNQHYHPRCPPSSSSIAATTTDVRHYQCHICDRRFARKHDLQRHIRVHTGDKPYACLCCKKAFARTDALKRHLRMEEICRTSPQVQAMKGAGKRRYKNL